MANAKFESGARILLRKNKNCAQLFVYFRGALLHRSFDGPLWLLRETKALNRNSIIINDPYDAYYQLGVGQEPANFDELMIRVERLVNSLDWVRDIYIVGMSTGAFAALECGMRLDATAIYCFAPDATGADEMEFEDIETANKVASAMNSADLKPQLMEHRCGEIKIFYSEGHAADAAKAASLSDVPRLSLVPMPGERHDPLSTIRVHSLAEGLFPAFVAAEPTPGAV